MKDEDKIIKQRSSILTIILITYIYAPYFINIMENTFKLSSLYGYIMYAILAITATITTLKVNKRAFLFIFLFLIVIILNYMVVIYKYYVLIEGVQALIGVLVPCVCISNNLFNLKEFTNKWWNFSRHNLILIIIAIILLKLKLVNYSIFTAICVPNVFIESYMILKGANKTKKSYVNIIINIVITAILGGRMAATVSVFMFLFAYLFSNKVKIWKKIIFIIFLIIITSLILNNLIDVLYWINQKLERYNIYSRSINILIYQLKNNEVYLTNRDYIYSVCLEYIKDRSGLPGGFGIPLYITSGEYYYVHNIALQFLTTFGIFGTIIIVESIYVRYKKIKNSMPTNCRKLIAFLALCYIGIGMTGSSIWIHYLSTIFISIFFLGNSRLYNSIE